MGKKNRKGKKRNLSIAQRAREMRSQIKGAQRGNFINRVSSGNLNLLPSVSARGRVVRNMGINPDDDSLSVDNQDRAKKFIKNYFMVDVLKNDRQD